uniref:Peptidyl-prolyl cis-trans isomerase n=1 Tax=Laticauda laticaudata TaxID=8630 RepID=A0A8C5S5S8_LATLA
MHFPRHSLSISLSLPPSLPPSLPLSLSLCVFWPGLIAMVVLASNPKNSVVFFNVTIGRQSLGHMKLELFANLVPKRMENSLFHRIMNDFMIQGDYFVNGDGTGMASIYWGNFADENFKLKYSAPSLLSMFFITCSKCDWLDGKHMVFGKIIDGLLIMKKN